VRGWGMGVNILEDARYWIGLLQYNLSSFYAYNPFALHPPSVLAEYCSRILDLLLGG
jgi:hypothetical protein